MPQLSIPARAAMALVSALAMSLAVHATDTSAMPKGEALARASDCFACHAVDKKVVGPAYRQVAQRYAGKGKAEIPILVRKIKAGGKGNWGDIAMTAHPKLSNADLTLMVKWILSLPAQGADAGAAAAATKEAGSHSYRTPEGKRVTTDFAVFTGPGQKQVTATVFSGYEQYNSYCFRCHGGDALGGEYAPDLRKSLANGMTFEQFLSTAMAGREAKGMPSWAGFFEEKDIRAIYDYIKARQLELVPVGRPPSAQD
ncbi:MAG: c-type cytochrome [Xanthomonadaceae bacterium]|nr:c-type cytochrome [Xanthomonadaceae bacterium]MDE2246955.1 c-type cytochrome [Xanthomonadaceae bacterium]